MIALLRFIRVGNCRIYLNHVMIGLVLAPYEAPAQGQLC